MEQVAWRWHGNNSILNELIKRTDSLDERWMRKALTVAERATAAGEVPVGAVVVLDDEMIGSGHNAPITLHDPSAHAEIIALRRAAVDCENYRLLGSTLYVTVEPCTMCIGAAIHARIGRLVYGASEPKAGAAMLLESGKFNHRIEVTSGVLAKECGEILSNFFRGKRARV